MTINEEIKKLKLQIASLQSKVNDLSRNTEDKKIQPYSKIKPRDLSQVKPIDPTVGKGLGNLPWNDSELKVPPVNQQPSTPNKGYNKHAHSRYAGGALDINSLELVEYETDEAGNLLDKNGNILNKHTQQFWMTEGKIKTIEISDGEGNSEFVDKIGNLDIEFDSSTRKWVAGSKYIDVEETFLVRRDSETGEFMLDENEEEMKSPLYNEDPLKSSVVWDSTDKIFRFYACYAPEPEEEE